MTRADRQGLGTSNKIEQKVAHVETKKNIFSWMMDNEKGTPENSVSKTNWQICAICQEATSEALQCPADTNALGR